MLYNKQQQHTDAIPVAHLAMDFVLMTTARSSSGCCSLRQGTNAIFNLSKIMGSSVAGSAFIFPSANLLIWSPYEFECRITIYNLEQAIQLI